jgi:flagellar motor switch protein FliN/FliY
MIADQHPDPLVDRLVQGLATAVDAIVGGVTTRPVEMPASGDGWSLTGSVTGSQRGTLEAWIDLGGAETLARRITGADAPDKTAIVALLRDLWTRATNALAGDPAFADLAVGFGAVRAAGAPGLGTVYELTADGFSARLVIASRLMSGPRQNLDVVLDIDLPLVVRFARTMLPLRTLAMLGPGSVVDMERSPDEPVQILVGDRVIAHGEVVVVGGNYGVKITDVTSPAARARLEA